MLCGPESVGACCRRLFNCSILGGFFHTLLIQNGNIFGLSDRLEESIGKACSFLLRIDSRSLVDLPTIFEETSFQQGAFMIPLPPCKETSFNVDRKCFVLSILVEYFSGSLLKFSKCSSPSLLQPVPIIFVVVVVSLGTRR
jgi:hypothetical protein